MQTRRHEAFLKRIIYVSE